MTIESQGDTCMAAVFSGSGQAMTINALPTPDLRTGEVLVRVSCCTVCGSDVHTFQGERSTPTPTILGHEIMGPVIALGPGPPIPDYHGAPLQVGDRVTWSIAASCGECFFCQRGIPQKCERLFKYGHERITPNHPLSGGLAEMCHLAPGTPILRVPDSLPDEVVCPANCATATVAAALRIAGGCQDQVVLIQGVGMLGLTACAMARCGGAREVIACDVDPHRVELAAGFGATRSVLVGWDGEELAGVVKDRTEGRGVDLAIDMSGAPSAMESGLDLLRIGGRYVLVGAVFPSRPLSISAETMVRRLLTIQGIHNYAPQDLAAAIDFLDQNHQRYPFVDLISETFPLTRVEAAFQYAVEQRPLRVAVIPATDNC